MRDLKDVITGPWALSHNKRKQIKESFRKFVLAAVAIEDARNEFWNQLAPQSKANQQRITERLTQCALAHDDFGLDDFDLDVEALLLDLV
jgi:hypothetical protein